MNQLVSGLKGWVPRLRRLAFTLVAVLVLTIFLAAIGATSLTILLFKAATRPSASQIDQINHRLDVIESRLPSPTP